MGGQQGMGGDQYSQGGQGGGMRQGNDQSNY